jgi:hypothetical protein
MDRRHFLTALIGTPAIALVVAACGDDRLVGGTGPATTGPATTVPGTTGPGTTAPPSTVPAGFDHPFGADQFVVRISYAGGFVGPNYDFVRYPSFLVTGDGRAVQTGAVPAVYPGPLLPPLLERTIDEAGVQALLAAADDAHLLGPAPDYSAAENYVADAADTVVEIHANGATYVHRCYALEFPPPTGGTETAARKNLAAFVALMTDLEKAAGAVHLGGIGPVHATSYRVQATPVDPASYGEPKPTVVDWPAGTGLTLADASKCSTVDAAKVTDLFASANQLTFFRDGKVVYLVTAVPQLPGDITC